MRGNIFDIQPFSLHDGPGIRTTVFFKGCPLHCIWCSNPEGLESTPTLSYQLSKCSNCLTCVDTCETGALTSAKGQLRVQHDTCNACGACIEVCPTGALKLYGYATTAKEVMHRVRKDKPFFEKSGGGITLSGGEVMMQPQFALEILKLAKEDGIHTCMETSGFARQEEFSALLPYLDLILFDYKITNAEKHRQFTGRSNNTILKNLNFLCENGAKIVLRTPVIPGINDTDAHFEAISDLSNRFKNIEKVELMPYHNWGSHKYQEIGMSAPNINSSTVSTTLLDHWIDKLKEAGCNKVSKS